LTHELIIIGAGASGLMAAITAKDLGMDVAILEGTDRVGRKILTTGNGRCNITNKYIETSRYHSNNNNFYNPVLETFSSSDTISFFEALGLPLVTLDEGKMYPMSLQASSVIDLLRLALEEKNIPVYLNTKAKEIITTKEGFKIFTSNGDVYESRKLILTTGGMAAPSTGSDGSGYNLAKNLNHSVIKPIPALVQLKLLHKSLKALSGVKFNGIAEVFVGGVSARKEFGEILFTDYGISGPPILMLSRTAALGISMKKEVLLKVDMLYGKSEDDLINYLETHWSLFGHRSLSDSFIGIINKKLIPILLKEAGIIDIHKSCDSLDWKEKSSIFKLLKCWEFKVVDTNSFNNSQVTAGGINTLEINPETLESKLVKNLYFAGELMDVDGDCGGFNLQWAWSSGYVAGKSAKELT
jgi:predicted Rossmann fold flavoprotein